MNIILLAKNSTIEMTKILFIIIILMNSIYIFPENSSRLNSEGNSSSNLIDQSINFLQESNCIKVHFKLFTETFAEKFYSYNYSLKSPDLHSKIFIIVAETISESNSRNSSFLIAELTTST